MMSTWTERRDEAEVRQLKAIEEALAKKKETYAEHHQTEVQQCEEGLKAIKEKLLHLNEQRRKNDQLYQQKEHAARMELRSSSAQINAQMESTEAEQQRLMWLQAGIPHKEQTACHLSLTFCNSCALVNESAFKARRSSGFDTPGLPSRVWIEASFCDDCFKKAKQQTWIEDFDAVG